MSQAYYDVVEKFVKMYEIIVAEDKDLRRKSKKVARIASALVMASIYSEFPLDKQFNVYKAMKQTMSEEMNKSDFKALGDAVDDIAANLILASEINKQLKRR